MEVSFDMDKIIKCAIYNTVFFPSGGGVHEMLMRLSLIIQMSIWCAFHSMSNIHTYFENHKWVFAICPVLFPVSIHTHLTHNSW